MEKKKEEGERELEFEEARKAREEKKKETKKLKHNVRVLGKEYRMKEYEIENEKIINGRKWTEIEIPEGHGGKERRSDFSARFSKKKVLSEDIRRRTYRNNEHHKKSKHDRDGSYHPKHRSHRSNTINVLEKKKKSPRRKESSKHRHRSETRIRSTTKLRCDSPQKYSNPKRHHSISRKRNNDHNHHRRKTLDITQVRKKRNRSAFSSVDVEDLQLAKEQHKKTRRKTTIGVLKTKEEKRKKYRRTLSRNQNLGQLRTLRRELQKKENTEKKKKDIHRFSVVDEDLGKYYFGDKERRRSERLNSSALSPVVSPVIIRRKRMTEEKNKEKLPFGDIEEEYQETQTIGRVLFEDDDKIELSSPKEEEKERKEEEEEETETRNSREKNTEDLESSSLDTTRE